MPPPEVLPRDARLIALLISSCPSITDAHPAVLHQLLEFAHRYTAQVLSDALVYSEHAGRGGNTVSEEDVKLAVQSRVGWEFGGKIPKEFLLSLSSKINSKPLPAVPEVFGVRLPPAKHCLTNVDFDLIPNKPPPKAMLTPPSSSEEEDEDDEDDEDAVDNDLEMADQLFAMPPEAEAPLPSQAEGGDDDGDDLFGEDDGDEAMEDAPEPNGILSNGIGEKRKVDDEDDDYDA